MIALDNLLQRSPQNMQQLESPRSSRPAESFLDARRPIHSAANSFAATESDNAGEHTPALQLGEHKMTSSVVPFPGATAEELSAQASRKRKRFGFFIVVLLIFLLAAAMKAGFLRSDSLDRTPPSSTKLETQLYSGTANKGMAQRSQENRLAEARAEPTPRSVANTVAATRSLPTKAKDEKEAKIKHKAEKSAGPAWGSYEVLRPVPVYRQPSEGSELLANLDSGMKVNVVDSRGGWLEIRSKHGRPPGFIRAETAVRVGNN
jgi:hypothetical protein